jgi:hypothetical protein
LCSQCRAHTTALDQTGGLCRCITPARCSISARRSRPGADAFGDFGAAPALAPAPAADAFGDRDGKMARTRRAGAREHTASERRC